MAIDFFYNLFKTCCVFQSNLSAQLLSRNRRKRRKWNAKGGKRRRKREERMSHHCRMVETGGPGAGHRIVAVPVAAWRRIGGPITSLVDTALGQGRFYLFILRIFVESRIYYIQSIYRNLYWLIYKTFDYSKWLPARQSWISVNPG